MGILAWIILGLIAGTIAKALMGGSGGWVTSLVLGVVGSLIGGWLGSMFIQGADIKNFFSPMTWIVSILGACLVLAVWGVLSRRKA